MNTGTPPNPVDGRNTTKDITINDIQLRYTILKDGKLTIRDGKGRLAFIFRGSKPAMVIKVCQSLIDLAIGVQIQNKKGGRPNERLGKTASQVDE